MLRLVSVAWLNTLMEIGTFCSRSSLRRAVTTITSGALEAADALAAGAGGAVGACWATACIVIKPRAVETASAPRNGIFLTRFPLAHWSFGHMAGLGGQSWSSASGSS
jgi:hypothetical protein